MAIKQRFLGHLVSQFHRPRGVGGRAAGWVMAHRGSNRDRNEWVVSLLDVQPADRVLEVGFGPGLAIAALAGRATEGRVYGIDHSALMVRQAARRNAFPVRQGRVTLRQADVSRLPPFGEPLDAIVAVNAMGTWPDPVAQLAALRALLRPGGRIALATQPRSPGATAETTARAARELIEWLTRAGFTEPRAETLRLTPPVACVLAINPAAG